MPKTEELSANEVFKPAVENHLEPLSRRGMRILGRALIFTANRHQLMQDRKEARRVRRALIKELKQKGLYAL